MDKVIKYNKTVLDNGVVIVSEENPVFYSSSIGIWLKCGSRHEKAHENGLSHFIEHMLFKGTAKRSAFDIAWQVDSIGGVLNAFTTRESTCYDIKVLSEHSELAIDILSDLFLNSIFENSEIEKERQVILQEIGMTLDTPDDYIHDLFYESFWGDCGLGRLVTGRSENVLSFNRNGIVDFYKKMYSPGKIVIAASGNMEHDKLVNDFSKYFNSLNRPACDWDTENIDYLPKVNVVKKKLEQVHLSLGVPALSCTSPDRYTLYILNTVLGEGMSSRLFQEVREKRGLVYNIYSYVSTYEKEGLLGVYAAMSKNDLYEVIEISMEEIRKLKENPLTEEELRSAKAQMKSNLLLGLESSENRMHRLAVHEIIFKREISVEESIENIESVTAEEVRLMAEKLFSHEKISMALLGDLNKREFLKRWQEIKVKLL
ncbi:MAG: insulinase family protein [Deltaproteobacteria bacterium]|nr:insulinase family protein [Deltaproteobacteria bacterium]